MAFRLPRNSLFAILLRSRWWLSVLLAFGVFALTRLFFPAGVAAFVALPFAAIGAYAAFRQLRRPGAKRIAKTLERARALPWDGFCAALEEAFRREGYAVTRTNGGADLKLTHEGRTTLVGCKRWKAVRTGIEPLRELEAASRAQGAHSCIYVAAGEVTDTARAFAAEKQIRLFQAEELAQLLAR
jgi:restriction system protein